MKKILYTLLAGVMALSSCSKSDEVPTPSQNDNTTTFSLAVEGAATRAAAAKGPRINSKKLAVTRAESSVEPARYIMEVWSEDGTEAENVFGSGNDATNHAVITSSSVFTVTLDKTKAYTCLFWADFDTDNASGSFNAASLKEISLNADKDVTEAYFAKVAVAKGKNPTVAVTLKRAVAKITLTETDKVKLEDNLLLKLSNIYPTFNVLDGEASGTYAEWTKTIQPSKTTGEIATLYFFAKAEAVLSDLTFTYAKETPKTVSNIPVQQNHATNIKGEFSNMFAGTFTITADDEWLLPVYKIGDLYPNANAPIGVVFWVDKTDLSYNDSDKSSAKGKIVGLDEIISFWSTEEIDTGANSETDGAANTLKVFALGSYKANSSIYPAFEWCASKNNTSTPAGISWYIPAKFELIDIYANKETLDSSLGSVSDAVPLSVIDCWSSTQGNNFEFCAWTLLAGNAKEHYKRTYLSVRAVSAF